MIVLPKDPGRAARTAWAANAVLSFLEETRMEKQGALPDLLCALMRWSDQNNSDFEEALFLARDQYRASSTAEPDQSEDECQPPPPAAPPVDEGDEPRWMQQVDEFEGLEIQPYMVLRGSCCGSYLEPCGRQEAEVWAVNGRYRAGGIEPCEDFATESEAQAFLDVLVSVYPHLARQAE